MALSLWVGVYAASVEFMIVLARDCRFSTQKYQDVRRYATATLFSRQIPPYYFSSLALVRSNRCFSLGHLLQYTE